jgi:hypothetical protein
VRRQPTTVALDPDKHVRLSSTVAIGLDASGGVVDAVRVRRIHQRLTGTPARQGGRRSRERAPWHGQRVASEPGYVFIVKWRTEGKVARFVIDGRSYRHPDAVLGDIEEAAQELSRRHLSAEIETSPIDPTQHGPMLPSWEEFRPRLTNGQELPPW